VTRGDSWAVNVYRNGDQILTIASRELSGIDLTPEDAAVIRRAAEQLLSFLGLPYQIGEAQSGGVAPEDRTG